MKHPGQFVREILRDFTLSRELAWALTMRDFKAQYRQSFIGYAWAFLPPLVASLTFILLRSGGAINVQDSGIPYSALVIIGTLLWQVFVDALQNPIRLMSTSKQMLIKINFPREALILSAFQMAMINLGIRLLILIPFLIYFQLGLSLSILLAPLGLLMLVLLGLCFGTFLAPLGGLYQDVQKGITMCLTFWMFLTPVVFPTVRAGLLGRVMTLNPVTPLLATTRDWMTAQPPQFLTGFWIVSALTLIGLAVAWLVYRVVLARVIERMGM